MAFHSSTDCAPNVSITSCAEPNKRGGTLRYKIRHTLALHHPNIPLALTQTPGLCGHRAPQHSRSPVWGTSIVCVRAVIAAASEARSLAFRAERRTWAADTLSLVNTCRNVPSKVVGCPPSQYCSASKLASASYFSGLKSWQRVEQQHSHRMCHTLLLMLMLMLVYCCL